MDSSIYLNAFQVTSSSSLAIAKAKVYTQSLLVLDIFVRPKQGIYNAPSTKKRVLFFFHPHPPFFLLHHDFYLNHLSFGMLSSSKMGLSTPTPIAFRPLSTYITAPVMADARGEARKAAVFPTSSADSSF